MATIRDRYQLDIDVNGASRSLSGLKASLGGLAGVVAGAFAVDQVVDFGRAIINTTKEFQNYQNQLRLITDGQADLQATTARLTQAAVENRASFGDTVDLYSKLTLATESMGKSQDEILLVTQKFQQALALSGADANTAAGAIRQFGQAMASGQVRGDEFNSIVEALGPALNIMARESGITVGQLRNMSQSGELTAEAFFDMITASQSLTAAFNQMEPTITQLETQLSDAFDRVLVKVGDALGITEAYENTLKSLIRIADDISNTEGALVNLADAEIFRKATEGAVSYQAALDELLRRINSENDFNPFTGEGRSDREIAALEGMVTQLAILKIEADAAARAQEELTARLSEEQRATNAATANIAQYTDELERYAKVDARSQVERLTDSQAEAARVIEALKAAQSQLNVETESGRTAFNKISSDIETATNAYNAYGIQINRILESTRQLSSFDQFYRNLIEGARGSVTEQTNATISQQRLSEELAAGRISVDVYAQAVERLNNILGVTDDAAKRASEVLENATSEANEYIRSLNESTEDAQFGFDSLNMDPLQKQLAQIERDMRRGLNAEVRNLQEAIENGANKDAIQSQIDAITASTETAIQQQQRIAEEAYTSQRTFQYGWEKAFDEYQKNASNAADQASRVFDIATKGMEDSIVNFAKTGKFEFRDLLSTIAEEILRSQVRQLIAGMFGGFNLGIGGGSGGANFAGHKAQGGFIPAGSFGIAGEAGPELITGPAQVTPLAGGSTVIYNINAVDAPSFQQLVARDPKFIHAVAERGRQSLTGVRR